MLFKYSLMYKFFKIIFLLIISVSFSPASVQAQFWKKIFNKEEHDRSKRPKAPPKERVVKQEAKKPKRIEPQYPAVERKESYRVDVLLPLYLNSLVVDGKAIQKNLPDHVVPFVHFYEGMCIAAEAMKDRRGKVDLYVHDITDPSSNIRQLTTAKKLAGSDLIIGCLQSAEIPAVAGYAKNAGINFVSALSPADAGIRGNPYFILMQSTLSTHIDQLIRLADHKYDRYPKFIFKDNKTSGEQDAYRQLRDAWADKGQLTVVDCSDFDMNIDSLSKLFDSSDINVVFVSVLEVARAEQILNILAQLPRQYRLEIFGMPSWKSLKGLTGRGALMEQSIYYTSPFYYDSTTGQGKYVSSEYKKRFGGQPSEMVYRGYETLCWYTGLLEQYGPVFNSDLNDVSAAPFTRYDIQPAWSAQNDFLYLENKKLYVFHYQNGGYIIEGN